MSRELLACPSPTPIKKSLRRPSWWSRPTRATGGARRAQKARARASQCPGPAMSYREGGMDNRSCSSRRRRELHAEAMDGVSRGGAALGEREVEGCWGW